MEEGFPEPEIGRWIMSYIIHALFQGPVAAEAALRELAMAGLPKDDYHVFVREPLLTEDLRTTQSDGRHGLFLGLCSGALVGGLLGWLLAGPLGILHHLTTSTAVAFGVFLGLICGALGGGLYGTGLVDSNLQRLVNRFRPGQTLVTAETGSLPSRNVVEQIFKLHGAIEATA
jgi:uncharacterized membrane protein